MARARSTGWWLAFAIIWLGFASRSAASTDEFKIIVHHDNPNSAIDRSFLRDIYLKKATSWRDGEAIRPIDLPSGSPTYEHFVQTVLNKTPSQLRSFWLQRIFSGTGLPPVEARSIAAVISYVRANRGAVAYLPIDVDPGGTKVIPIR